MIKDIRIGFGYDVHAFSEDRELFLGGVKIPSEKGLKGHSDADVLLHAICDALFGALALGDIGIHFPDTDPKYKGIESKILLEESYKIIRAKGFILNNIDSTVVMEKPKLKPHILDIRKSISKILDVELDRVSVKATTSEKLGFVGKEEGVKAYANVLLMKVDE